MSVPLLSSSGLPSLNTSKLDVSEYYEVLLYIIRQEGIMFFINMISPSLLTRFESELKEYFSDPYGCNSRMLMKSVVETSMILFDDVILKGDSSTADYDRTYHRQKYLDSFLESYLAVFLLSSEWFDDTKCERIITDIFILCFTLQKFYFQGIIVKKAKQLFGHVNRDLLMGSFLKQYLKMKRSRTIPIDISEHFLYSIDMMKKGLHVLPLDAKVQNVRASLGLLCGKPDPYHFDDIYYDIALACIPTPQYEKKDRAPSTKSSYECRKGSGISDMYSENFLSFCQINTGFTPITEMNCYRTGKNRKNYSFRYKTVPYVENKVPWTTDIEENEKIYSELIDDIHAKFVDFKTFSVDPWSGGDAAARVVILDEANKNRFLTIQRWVFQNGARSFQKHALKNCWFESEFATHRDVNAQTLHEVLNANKGPIGELLISIDYSSATDYMHPEATAIAHSKLLDKCGVKGLERAFLETMFHPKYFDLRSLLLDHPDYPPTAKGFIHPHLKRVSDEIEKEFGGMMQQCGQMMGNPLSFATLCLINTAVCISSLLKDRGYIVERWYRGYSNVPDQKRFFVTRLRDEAIAIMTGKQIRKLLGPISINGDDGFLTGSSDLPEIHKAEAKGVGLVLNELKTEKHPNLANMNSVRFLYDRECNELRVTGYVNLSLLFSRNVKSGRDECVEDDLGSNLTTLLTQSSPFYQERIYTYYRSIHKKTYDKACKVWSYNRDLKCKTFDYDYDLLEILPKYLGGLGMPVSYEDARNLPEQTIERRFVHHSKSVLRVQPDIHRSGLPGWNKPVPPPNDRLHSYRMTAIAKKFALELVEWSNAEFNTCLTIGPISPNSVPLSDLLDKCIQLFSKKLRITPLWDDMYCDTEFSSLFEGIDLSETILHVGDASISDLDDPFYKINLFIDDRVMRSLDKFSWLFVLDSMDSL